MHISAAAQGSSLTCSPARHRLCVPVISQLSYENKAIKGQKTYYKKRNGT